MAHVFNDLKSASLISLGRLCDDDCKIVTLRSLERRTSGVAGFTEQ